MGPPTHMLLKDRKAYALLATYHGIVRQHAAASDATFETGLGYFGTRIDEIAKEVARADTANELDAFLVEAIDHAERSTGPIVKPEAMLAISPIVTALRAHAASIRCSNCYNGAICCGEAGDDE